MRDSLLDQQPPIREITTHARTAEWCQLGVQLGLDGVGLGGCRDYTSMYQLWIQEKADNAWFVNLTDQILFSLLVLFKS